MEGCQQLDFLSCNKCTEDYELINGECILKNCSVWDNGVCFVCNKGYVTQQGSCIKDPKLATAKTD